MKRFCPSRKAACKALAAFFTVIACCLILCVGQKDVYAETDWESYQHDSSNDYGVAWCGENGTTGYGAVMVESIVGMDDFAPDVTVENKDGQIVKKYECVYYTVTVTCVSDKDGETYSYTYGQQEDNPYVDRGYSPIRFSFYDFLCEYGSGMYSASVTARYSNGISDVPLGTVSLDSIRFYEVDFDLEGYDEDGNRIEYEDPDGYGYFPDGYIYLDWQAADLTYTGNWKQKENRSFWLPGSRLEMMAWSKSDSGFGFDGYIVNGEEVSQRTLTLDSISQNYDIDVNFSQKNGTLPVVFDYGTGHEELAAKLTAYSDEFVQDGARVTVPLEKTRSKADAQEELAFIIQQTATLQNSHFVDQNEIYLAVGREPKDNYSDVSEVEAELELIDKIEEGDVFYVHWMERIKEIDVTLKAPTCVETAIAEATSDGDTSGIRVADGSSRPSYTINGKGYYVVEEDTSPCWVYLNWSNVIIYPLGIQISDDWKTATYEPVTFQPGETYEAFAMLRLKYGYIFDGSVSVKNGGSATVIPGGVEGAGVGVYLTNSIKAEHGYGDWEYLNEEQHQRVCEYDSSHVDPANHEWDITVTTAPTLDSEGEELHTCSVCGYEKKVVLPQLTPAENAAQAIDTIPEEISLEDEEAIVAARETYEALTEEEKAEVPEETLKKLEEAEAALQELKDTAAKEQAEKEAAEKEAAEKAAAEKEAAEKAAAEKEAAEKAAAEKEAAEKAAAEKAAADQAAYKQSVKAAKALKVSGLKVKAKKGKKATITWKVNKKATGYQLQYSTSKKFTKKTTKTVTIKKESVKKKVIKKLKAKKTYYVRIRTATKIKNPTTEKNVTKYGVWSGVKRFKAKK